MSFLIGRDLVSRLRGGRRALADSAVGSELIKSGTAPGRTVEANLSHPERVRRLHKLAILSGADAVTSNTFGMSGSPEWAAAFYAGVKIAVAEAHAAEPEIAVMISVYPSELLENPDVVLMPWKNRETSDCLLLIETAVDLRETVAAVALARQNGVDTVAATCHFQTTGVMPDGSMPKAIVSALQKAGASVLGGNCGSVPEDWVLIAEHMRRATDLPLLFQPNAGLPQQVGDRSVYSVDPIRFAANAARLYDVGVSMVGGCCGTTPAHIAAIRSLVFDPQRRE